MTNLETRRMFRSMVRSWFKKGSANYNDFIQALLSDDLEAKGIPATKIRKYGFAFEGQNVLIQGE